MLTAADLKRRETERKFWQIAAVTSTLWTLLSLVPQFSSVDSGIFAAFLALIMWFFRIYLPDYKGDRTLLVVGILVGLFIGVPVVAVGGLWVVGHLLVWLHVIP